MLKRVLLFIAVCLVAAAFLSPHAFAGRQEGEHVSSLGLSLPLYSGIPFVGILLSIALFPLFAPRFWHHHYIKVSLAWALIFAVPFVIAFGGEAVHEILHIFFLDYFPFIILLWALFTVSGGILIEGSLKGTPFLNTLFLLVGTFSASFIGTMGASMLLIRPLLRANSNRRKKVHLVVFFIFLVSNIGGSLTPLGDPPLFLGFLHGVPFFWTFSLFPQMCLVAVILILLFFCIDSWYFKREGQAAPPAGLEREAEPKKLGIRGGHNLLFLAGVMGAVLMSGILKAGTITFLGIHFEIQNLMRDGILILLGLLSLWSTSGAVRKENEFSWFPIQEVAFLFAGIFMTIIPVLAILQAGTEGGFGFVLESVKDPVGYFWITGLLSSFLDNAPTYLTFLSTALGTFFANTPEIEAIHALIAKHEIYLKAISLGAVFMGANTYIGNAPNFVVKSIAEMSGVRMPTFFGYLFKYSLPILFPIFLLITFLFFS